MRSLIKAYDAVIVGLAVLAGAMVAAVFVMILYDVTLRATGFQPPIFTSALTEYALLYLTMLAAPWLVRTRGHVFVESFTLRLGRGARRVVERFVYLLCIALCLILSYYAVEQALDMASRGEEDWRSIVMPRWVLFAALPIGFVPAAVEFARFLFGRDSMYAGERHADGI